jgi:PAS domain S-box-containing protein
MAQEHKSPTFAMSANDQDILMEQYQSIIESTGFVIFTCNAKGIFTHVSSNVKSLTGYSAKQTVGASFQTLVKPDWVDRVTQHYVDALESDETRTLLEFPIITAKGEERWVEQIVVIVNSDDKPVFQAIVRDITEQKRAIQDLRDSQQRLQLMVEHLPTGAAYIEGNDILFNRAVEEITGYKRGDIKTLDDWFKAIYREKADEVQASYEQDRIHGFPKVELFPIYHKDGSQRLIEFSTYQSESGEVWLVNDVTERHQAEQAHKDNERRFRGLFEKNNDAVFIIGLDDKISLANQQAADMLGYSLDEIIGSHSDRFIAESERTEIKTRLEQLMSGVASPIYERRFQRKNGEEFLAEINVALAQDEDGNPLHIQSIVRDITDRQRTEAQLAERVNQLTTLREVDAELVDRLNVDYVLTMALDSAMRLSAADAGFIGLADDNDVLRLAKIVGDYHTERIESFLREGKGMMQRVIRTMEPEFIPDVQKDPDYIPVRESTKARITIPLVSQERLIGILNLEASRDNQFNEDAYNIAQLVTARIAVSVDNARLYRQTEQQLGELQELYERVSNLEQLKSDMIRIASHDLRNPLATILGYTEIMRYELDDLEEAKQETGELPDFVKQMEKAANHMRKIISDILSLERIEQAAQYKDYIDFDLRDLVNKTFADNESRAKLSKQTLTLEIPDAPTIINGDPVQLGEALSNLINNAIKYTPDKGTIEVRLIQDGENALFEVKDNGYGIPNDQQDKLFQPFYRAQMDETASIEGTGLGLHLVKNIVERHSGTIWLESVHKKGSTFSVMIPLSKGE